MLVCVTLTDSELGGKEWSGRPGRCQGAGPRDAAQTDCPALLPTLSLQASCARQESLVCLGTGQKDDWHWTGAVTTIWALQGSG